MTRGREYFIARLQECGFSYRQASRILNLIIASMTEALRKGEDVELPFGTLKVVKHRRKPRRGWYFNRVATSYKQTFTVVLNAGDASGGSTHR